MNLANCTPQRALASTQYCLADPGREYVVYLPAGGKVTVDLSSAKEALAVEWINPQNGRRTEAPPVAGQRRREFTAPFTGDAVLYLFVP